MALPSTLRTYDGVAWAMSAICVTVFDLLPFSPNLFNATAKTQDNSDERLLTVQNYQKCTVERWRKTSEQPHTVPQSTRT